MQYLRIHPETRIVRIKTVQSKAISLPYFEAYLNDRPKPVYLGNKDVKILEALGAEIIAPQFCLNCKKRDYHIYLLSSDKVYCLLCGAELDETSSNENIINVDFKQKKNEN